MVQKLWQKGKTSIPLSIEKFETADDLAMDNHLAKWDVLGTLAHGLMLVNVGLLNQSDIVSLHKASSEILALIEAGQFDLKMGDEDIHTKVENFITEKYGDLGKRIHTGRSRNDQVLLDMRLFIKSSLNEISIGGAQVVSDLLDFAKKHEAVVMPGYTHMQKAMPSSVGLWAGSYAESILDTLTLLETVYSLNDQSPLGSAAGYGTNLPLDREFVAEKLGFSKVQNNSLYTQNSRGLLDAHVLYGLSSLSRDFGKFASDLLLFTTSEFSYFSIDSSVCTGSSIMPQKKNLDLAELIRSKTYYFTSRLQEVFLTPANIPSGYNRDLQDTKKPIIESLNKMIDLISVFKLLIGAISSNVEILKKSMSNELYATAHAYDLIAEGIPFREAYLEVAKDPFAPHKKAPDEYLRSSTSSGTTHNLLLSQSKNIVKSKIKKYELTKAKFEKAIEELLTRSRKT